MIFSGCSHKTHIIERYQTIDPPAHVMEETAVPLCKQEKIRDVFHCLHLYHGQLSLANKKTKQLQQWHEQTRSIDKN